MSWLPWLALALCLLALTVLGLDAYGSLRWAEMLRVLKRRIEAAPSGDTSQSPPGSRYDEGEIVGLPAPVQRYFRAVLKHGQPIVRAVMIDMAGTINMSATAEQWKPFTSTQRVVTRRPGFLWDARISLLPGLKVNVVDSYSTGHALMRAAMLGLFTVANVGGRGEMARGEFMRYFADTPWYPTALLPSQGVRWAAVDDRCANATITDGLLSLTMLFRFNDAGLIDSIRAEARGGMVGDQVVMMPWECGLSNYQVRNGMTVPTTGEAAYVRPDGRKAYFHGTVTSLTCEFSPCWQQ